MLSQTEVEDQITGEIWGDRRGISSWPTDIGVIEIPHNNWTYITKVFIHVEMW